MKLHLPKALLVAVLSVFTALSASAFGPTDVTYTEVTGDVNSAQTPTADTLYSSVSGAFDISGSGYDIKLEGKNSNDEYVLGNITADSTWLSDSRFTINSSNRLANAGNLYINGGATLQVLGEVTLANDITLGTSTYHGGWANEYVNIKNAALLLGYWGNTNKSVTISGALDIQEDARIALQYGYELNHTGKLTGSADLNISHYTGGDNSSTVTLSGTTDYTGNISLTGYSGAVLTLKLTTNTFKLQTEAASIAVGSNTVLDLSGYSLSNFESINDNTTITTTGSGYILLAKSTSASEITLPGDSNQGSDAEVNITSISKNYKVEGSLNINGAGYKKNDGRTRTLIVGDDRSFVTTGALSLVSNAVLKIEGGTVQAGSIALGHGEYHEQPPYWGKIEMSGGSLKTGTITMQQHYANVVDISGGTLEFTQATAINVATNRNSSVKIVGKDASNRVTLKTGSTAWHLNGTGLKEALVGNVTIDGNNARAITLSNVQLTGNIVNNATLTLGEGISIKSGDTVTLSGSSIGISCALTNNGTLVLDGAISATGYDYTGVDDSLVTYSDNGTDGFKVYQTGKEFYLVEGGGTTIAENCEFTFNGLAAEVVSENNKANFVLKEDCTNETIYYVRTKDFTVDGTANNPAANATGYDVASGRTLTIAANQSDSMTASTILSTTTGGGNITLATSATMTSAAQAQGKLTIENGAVLTMDVGKNNACTYLASFSSIDLNNATIEYRGSDTTFNNVTVGEAGAGLHIKDMQDSSKVITFGGTTTLDGNLSIESYWRGEKTWKYGVNIAELTGSGNLTIKGTTHAESNNEKNNVTAKLLSTYTGAITAERSTNNNSTTSVELTTDGDVSLKGLNLLNGATGKITATGTLGLGDVDLTGDSTLTIMNSGGTRTTTMTSLDVTGEAVVQIERNSSCHNGTINIEALNGENATVTFRNGSYTSYATAFNLKGGAFSGTIKVEGNSAGAYDRPVHLNLNSGTVAENAVIQFLNPTTSDSNNKNKITLGVGAAEVKVAGLSGVTTNAATVKSTDAAATRTLVINTAENESYTTNAVVDSSVNLHKMGAGTQEFSADMSGYTGSIAVMAGELRFSATELMNVGGVNVGTAGTLTAHATEKTGHISTSGQVELAAGATINGSVTLNNGATLEMTGLDTVDSGITLKGSLVIEDKQTLVTALSSYVKSRSGVSSIRIFSGLTGLTVGDYTFSDKNNLVDLSTWDTSGTFTSENTYFITYDSDNGNVDLSMGEMVPEPTTTTLSLLALTALAARRRRKLK